VKRRRILRVSGQDVVADSCRLPEIPGVKVRAGLRQVILQGGFPLSWEVHRYLLSLGISRKSRGSDSPGAVIARSTRV
jgi:hypothetical protein